MRLTVKQLRNIIAEEVARVKGRRLAEGFYEDFGEVPGEGFAEAIDKGFDIDDEAFTEAFWKAFAEEVPTRRASFRFDIEEASKEFYKSAHYDKDEVGVDKDEWIRQIKEANKELKMNMVGVLKNVEDKEYNITNIKRLSNEQIGIVLKNLFNGEYA